MLIEANVGAARARTIPHSVGFRASELRNLIHQTFRFFSCRGRPRLGRPIGTRSLTLVGLLFCLGLFDAHPARADWYSYQGINGNCPNPVDYGEDYYAAAEHSISCAGGNTANFWAMGFRYNSYGTLSWFDMCQDAVAGGGVSCDNWAYNYCPAGVQTSYGCPVALDYPGCNCRNSKPGDAPGDAPDPNPSGQDWVAAPINVASGNMFETAIDFRTAGQNPLSLRRFYNSLPSYVFAGPPPWSQYGPVATYTFLYSRFGNGWRSEYDRFVVPGQPGVPPNQQSSTVDAIRADGEPVHFAWNNQSGGWYVAYYGSSGWSSSGYPRSDIDITLTTDANNYYIKDGNDTVEQYDETGRLNLITYRGGYQQTLTYSNTLCGGDQNNNPITCNTGVSDSEGRQITFNYLAGTGLVSSMVDAAGNTTQYNYVVPIGNPPAQASPGFYVLSQVVYPDNSTIEYSYNDPVNHFALTGITDEDNNSFAGWQYDSVTQRATSSQFAGGADLTTVQYSDGTSPTRTITNALGKEFVYSLNPFQGHFQISQMEGLPSAHTPDSIVSYQYDSNGFLNLRTSGESRQTYYVNDQLGRPTTEIDGYQSQQARTITTLWDANYDLPDTITEPNLTIGMSYPNGLLTQLTETDTTTQTVPYRTNGEARTWQFGYYSGSGQCSPAAGLLESVQGPLGATETTTYCYNSNGFVSSVTNPLGQVTQVTAWNVWGEPLTSIDPNNVSTTYTYDLRARLKSINVNPGSNQSLTQIGYDNSGNLTSITFPDNSSLTYGYDPAHRLKSVTNNLGEKISYTLDAAGDRTATTAGTSSTTTKSQTATFDELARLLTGIGAYSQTTQHGYDRDNNEVSTVDPRNKLYQHAFDTIERVMQEIDPDNYQTNIGYNGKDEVTGVSDARSLQTAYVRDGFGDIIQITSPDTGVTKLWYDANGKLTKRIDAAGVETDYTNDVLGRVKSRKIHGTTTETVNYTWDVATRPYGIGRLGKIADPSGATVFSYDAFGKLIKDSRTVGATTYPISYTNDAAGHVQTITYPSGRIVTYTRDGFGRVSGVTTNRNIHQPAVTIVSNGLYEPFGPLASLGYGNGVTLEQGWDLDYHLASIDAASGSNVIQNLTYGDDASGNIQTITDNLNSARTQGFTFDDLNRLWTASGLYGSQSYTYDGVGNRATATIGGVLYTYNPSSTSNQIVSITQTGGGRYFYYQPTGQVYSDQRNATFDYQFGYDGYGHMTSSSLNSTSLATYGYNGLDQRAVKTAATNTDFLYDRVGHLLAEANDATGAMIREYIWMDDTPVAMVDDTGSSPVVYDIHTDHLGRPQKLTNQSATLAWDGVFDPFGNVTSVTGSVTMLLMFPGQYYDSETQVSQNWHRDYDPTIGRYVESDPFGLAGGINTYSYVRQNPLDAVDTPGLQEIAIPMPWDLVEPLEMTAPDSTLDPAVPVPVPDTSQRNNRPCDPCKGLRKQIQDHEKKLADYIADPYGHDNLGMLGQGYDSQIIPGRIKSIQDQIDNFRKQLQQCEQENSSGPPA